MVVSAFGLGCWLGQLSEVRFGPASLALPAVAFIVAGTILIFVYHRGLVDLLQNAYPTLPPTVTFPKS